MPRRSQRFVDVERLVIQAFIGTAPWDHRPLIQVLVGQVAARLGEPDGIIAFDPSSFPKRGRHSVGVKRPWCSHRGKVDNCQVGVFMGYVSRHDHALLDFRLSLPQDWARDAQRRKQCHVPPEVRYHTRHEQCLEMLDAWGEQVPHGWVTGDESWVATRGFAVSCEHEASGMCWPCPAPPRCATWRSPCRRIRGAAGGPRPHGNRCVPGGKHSTQRGGRA